MYRGLREGGERKRQDEGEDGWMQSHERFLPKSHGKAWKRPGEALRQRKKMNAAHNKWLPLSKLVTKAFAIA